MTHLNTGMVLGYNYIRGCADKLFLPGVLNQSALETHGFHFVDLCRALPWRQLVHLPRGSGATRPHSGAVRHPNNGGGGHHGQVVLCSCYGNRCNGRPAIGGRVQDSRGTTLRATCALLVALTSWRLINRTWNTHVGFFGHFCYYLISDKDDKETFLMWYPW